MLGKLFQAIDKYRDEREARRVMKHPTVEFGLEQIRRYWTANQELVKDFSPGFVTKEAEAMLEKVIQIALSPNPIMANREVLSDRMIGYAESQVLVLEPPPAVDGTGLRGLYGISGVLKSRLVEIAQKHKTIIEFMHQFPEVKTWDDVWNPVLFRYRINYGWAHVFSALRVELKDYNSERDWFSPYLACMCAWDEHRIRESIGMPSLLDEDPFQANMKALTLSSFLNRVMEGHKYPDLAWTNLVSEGSYAESLKLVYQA
jgi:hypothetical protein